MSSPYWLFASILIAAHLLTGCKAGTQPAPGWMCKESVTSSYQIPQSSPEVIAYYAGLSVAIDVPNPGNISVEMAYVGRVYDSGGTNGSLLFEGEFPPVYMIFSYAWDNPVNPSYIYIYSGEESTGSSCYDTPWPDNYQFSCCQQCPEAMSWFTGKFPVITTVTTMSIIGWPEYLGQSLLLTANGCTCGASPRAALGDEWSGGCIPPLNPLPPCATTPAPAPSTTPVVSTCSATLSPPSGIIDFALPVQVGSCSATNATFTITNPSYSIAYTTWSITPGPINGFSVYSDSCTGTLATSSSCSVTITFCPTSAGIQTALFYLQASCDITGEIWPLQVSASATAAPTTPPPTTTPGPTTTPPVTTPAPTTPAPNYNPTVCAWSGFVPPMVASSGTYYWDFGIVPVTTCSFPKTFTFTAGNTAGQSWSSFSYNFQFPVPGSVDMAVTANTCTGTVAPGGTCSISIIYCPKFLGVQQATFVMNAVCSGSQYEISWDGTGAYTGPLQRITFTGQGQLGVKRRSARLPGIVPGCITATTASTGTTAAATATTSGAAATTSSAAVTGFTTSFSSTTASTSTTSASATTSVTSTIAAAAATGANAAATSAAAASTTSFASTTTSAATGATSVSTVTTGLTASTTSAATSTGVLPSPIPFKNNPVFPQDSVAPVVACTPWTIFSYPDTAHNWWQESNALYFNFKRDEYDPIEYVGVVNLHNSPYELDEYGTNGSVPFCGTYDGPSGLWIVNSFIDQITPYPSDLAGPWYFPPRYNNESALWFATYGTSNDQGLNNNCPYSEPACFSSPDFGYGPANACGMDVAFNPYACAEANGGQCSGSCTSYLCHTFSDTSECLNSYQRVVCAALIGSYWNYNGKCPPSPSKLKIIEDAARERWAQSYGGLKPKILKK